MKLKDLSMCDRLAEEIYKTGETTNRGIARKIGCSHKIVSDWLAGRYLPTAYHLKSMYEAGLDVIYILTGKRTR